MIGELSDEDLRLGCAICRDLTRLLRKRINVVFRGKKVSVLQDGGQVALIFNGNMIYVQYILDSSDDYCGWALTDSNRYPKHLRFRSVKSGITLDDPGYLKSVVDWVVSQLGEYLVYAKYIS